MLRRSVPALALAFVLLVVLGLWWAQSRFVPSERGDLSRLVRDVVDAMPARGSEGYERPSPEEASEFSSLASSMAAGDVKGARRSALSIGYALVSYEDLRTGRRLLVAREEARPADEADRGWGMIVADPGGDDVLVEVAHPDSDLRTPEVGVDLFRKTRARTLLVAGAHRASWEDGRGDVAHAPGTAFDAAHEALLPAEYVIQPHGFHEDNHDGYPEIVLSAGAAPPPATLVAVREALNDAGFEAGLWDGGERFESLAATGNLQGRSTREAGGGFVHLELARDLREDGEERPRLATVLARALRHARFQEPGGGGP